MAWPDGEWPVTHSRGWLGRGLCLYMDTYMCPYTHMGIYIYISVCAYICNILNMHEYIYIYAFCMIVQC